jgi:hypothetical protein
VKSTLLNFIFMMALFDGSALNASEGVHFLKLTTGQEIKKERCESSYGYIHSGVCNISNNPLFKIYIPLSIGRIISEHITKMEKTGYFQKMDPEDFFHGHFILRSPKLHYESLNSYLSDVTGILYHTGEYSERWHSPKDKARSLFGNLNGKVVPAISLIPESQTLSSAYEKGGTVYISDLVEARPLLSVLGYSFGSGPEMKMDFFANGKTWECTPEGEFEIRLEKYGRFKLSNKQTYEMFLYCELPVS